MHAQRMQTRPGQRRSAILLGLTAAALFSFSWLAVSGGLPGALTRPVDDAIAVVRGPAGDSDDPAAFVEAAPSLEPVATPAPPLWSGEEESRFGSGDADDRFREDDFRERQHDAHDDDDDRHDHDDEDDDD